MKRAGYGVERWITGSKPLLFLSLLVPALNLLFVVLDALYLASLPYCNCTLRDLLLDTPLVPFYDPWKGIERDARLDEFLLRYAALKRKVDDGISPAGEETSQLIAFYHTLFEEREGPRAGVAAAVDAALTNHFAIGKIASPISVFFSPDRLVNANRNGEFAYFDRSIVPILNRLYLRAIEPDGLPADFFYRIDRWFVLFFFLEFLFLWGCDIRSGSRWSAFPLRRKYEVFFLYPPEHAVLFRLLRVIPFLLRIRRVVTGRDEGVFGILVDSRKNEIAPLLASRIVYHTIRTAAELFAAPPEQRGTPSEAELRRCVERVLRRIEPELVDYLRFAIDKAAEPWLVSPLGRIFRFLLLNFHIGIKDALEAAFLSPEGQERFLLLLGTLKGELLQEGGEGELSGIATFLTGIADEIARRMDRLEN